MTLLFSHGYMNANMYDIFIYILACNIWNLYACNICLHGN